MQVSRRMPYVIAVFLGIIAAAVANKPVPITYVDNPTYTNCGTWFECNEFDHYTGTISPCCCSVGSNGCQNYAIDTWQCVAGGTLYRNFRASTGPYPGATCGGGGWVGCH
jgi:hypothetical protein